jgi:arsenate reductase
MEKFLVLCTGNSCRSIIAEYLINHLGEGLLHAVSADSLPAGYVHPKSLKTLELQGIAVENPRSKSWHEFASSTFDVVITVCDNAANETGPMFAGNVDKLHWSTPDPAAVEGSDEEVNQAFEAAYQMLKTRIEAELLLLKVPLHLWACSKSISLSVDSSLYCGGCQSRCIISQLFPANRIC